MKAITFDGEPRVSISRFGQVVVRVDHSAGRVDAAWRHDSRTFIRDIKRLGRLLDGLGAGDLGNAGASGHWVAATGYFEVSS